MDKFNLILQSFLVLITIVGWFVAYLFNLRQQRKNLELEAKYRVYEKLWSVRGVMHNSFSSLSSQIFVGPPFILMESCGILGGITGKQEDVWKGEQDAIKLLFEYRNNLSKLNEDFGNTYLQFWRDVEMWLHVMPELEQASRILFSEFGIIRDKIYKHLSFLQSLNASDWKKINKTEIKERCETVWEEMNNLSSYAEDFMGLIHNELIGQLFDYTKSTRKPLDPKYKVLTKNGLKIVD